MFFGAHLHVNLSKKHCRSKDSKTKTIIIQKVGLPKLRPEHKIKFLEQKQNSGGKSQTRRENLNAQASVSMKSKTIVVEDGAHHNHPIKCNYDPEKENCFLLLKSSFVHDLKSNVVYKLSRCRCNCTYV